MPEAASVSRETEALLDRYAALLTRWNARINLIGRGSVRDLAARHLGDSLQLADLAPLSGQWADLGSGGGLPGAVIAIAMKSRREGGGVTCIESDQRKSAFLRTVAHELALPMRVVAQRAEAAPAAAAEVLTARALAALPTLLGYAERHLATGGVGLFPKGKSWRQELEAARRSWQFSCDIRPSTTDAEAVILRIGDLVRAPHA